LTIQYFYAIYVRRRNHLAQKNSGVKVTKIQTGSDGNFLWKLDFSDRSEGGLTPQLQVRIKTMLIRFSKRARHAFLLEWEGGRVPAGAVVQGRSIVSTKEGCALDEHDGEVGIYERILDSGGTDRKLQKMLLFVR